ncbi:hypothetical protein WG901_11245 [Novosphingobium sp. PS1R-30]|uniref:Uncharacterized protein n=1 Tax=Novosphingobium anseongense TaxID=3133436 RepID=A0ABU8RW26_9SPHN
MTALLAHAQYARRQRGQGYRGKREPRLVDLPDGWALAVTFDVSASAARNVTLQFLGAP